MTTTSSDITATQSFSSPDDEEDSDDPSVLPLPWSPFFVVYSTVAIVTAVGGNVLILLSYGRDGQLRDVHNLYLLHLAVCDLLIGAVSMPLYLIYTVLYWRWPMGVVMCKLFLVEDYTLCCMSTLIIILVAADRLALLTLGASYQAVETRKRAYIKLAVCWTCSFLLYSPAILLWDVVTGHSVVPEGDCDVEFNRSIVFVMVTEIISFSVPFVSLAVINGQLLVALKKRRKVGDHQASGPSPKKERSTTNYKDDDTSSKFATESGHALSASADVSVKKEVSCQSLALPQATAIPSSDQSHSLPPVSELSVCPNQLETSSLAQDECPNQSEKSSLAQDATTLDKRSNVSTIFQATTAHSSRTISAAPSAARSGQVIMKTVDQQPGKERRGRKVTVILAGLVVALVVFWLPYSITTILWSVCGDCVNQYLYEAFNWWLWTKSCINPFLYAYHSPRFRRNFQQLLSRVLPHRLSSGR